MNVPIALFTNVNHAASLLLNSIHKYLYVITVKKELAGVMNAQVSSCIKVRWIMELNKVLDISILILIP